MSRPLIKVCGIRSTEVARVALDAGADRLGLVFAPSPRRVDPDVASRLVEAVHAAWVGVFVDAPLEILEEQAEQLDLAALQLHGDESPEACRRIREATGRTVWKALRWADGAPLEEYVETVDSVVLDASSRARFGGTGQALPWHEIGERLPPAERPVPVVLAGGLDADNVAHAIEACRPEGVDASSRLERSPGEKDPARVRAFVKRARMAGAAAASGRTS